MKQLSFKIKFDEEFQDYYFTPFKDKDYYVWINDILESDNGLIAITEFGYIPVINIDMKNMKVLIQI